MKKSGSGTDNFHPVWRPFAQQQKNLIHIFFYHFKGGSGTSNTGNIGWTLVEKAEKVAEIIFDLDPDHSDFVPIECGIQIIEGLGNFLIAINSKFVLHSDMFDRFCNHVDRLMIQWLEWHPSVPSVHLG